MKQPFRKKTLCVLVSSVLMGAGSGSAIADDAAATPQAAEPASAATPAPAAPAPTSQLGAIVVTASSQSKSVLESSLSVSDISSELVEALAPTSQAEVLRMIPGIIPSQGSPGGNANIAVRGLPVPQGGSPFVQLQEDGLPTVLFGDMQFGNNDYWTKFDHSNTIQAVRGGSASTLASQAPGAVINYISDTGTRKGGEVSLSAGLNYDEQRVDFAVGGPIAEGWRFHTDGYLVQGNGLQDPGFQAEKGYQIKANVTHDLDGGKGYIRGYIKLLDDQEPYQNQAPVTYTVGNGGNVTGVHSYPGYSAGTFATTGPASQYFNVANLSNGQLQQVQASGIHPKAEAFGAELHYLPGGGWVLDDKFRYTNMSGTFSTYFLGFNPASSYIGNPIGAANGSGRTVTGFRYNNGQTVSPATMLSNSVQVYTNVSDAGSLANDASLSRQFSVFGKNDVNAKAGVFYMNQHYAADWHPNYTFLTSGPQGVPVNPVSGSVALAQNGVAGYNGNWGNGTGRIYDIQAPDTAPYLTLGWDHGSLSLDASVRRDLIRVTGITETGSANTLQTVTGPSSIPGTTSSQVGLLTLDPATTQPANYGISYNSWSAGALYLLDDNNSVFARASRGGRANFDRFLPNNNVNAITGALNPAAVPTSYSVVLQQEIGFKSQGDFADGKWGRYSTEFTLFHDEFSYLGYDLTLCNPTGSTNCGQSTNNAYSARGFEWDGTYGIGNFGLTGQITYSDGSLDTANTCYPQTGCGTGTTGIQPNGVPSVTYMLSPSYRTGPYYGALVITGANATPINVGTANVYLEPYTLVSLVGSYAWDANTSFSLHVNNLFNSIASTYINGLSAGMAPGTYTSTATVAYGRTVVGSVTFKF